MNERREPTAAPGAVIKFVGVGTHWDLPTGDEVETQRRFVGVMLGFRREITLGIEHVTAAAPAHRFDHATPVKAQH